MLAGALTDGNGMNLIDFQIPLKDMIGDELAGKLLGRE